MSAEAQITFPMGIDASPLFTVLKRNAEIWSRQLDVRSYTRDMFKNSAARKAVPIMHSSNGKTGKHVNVIA